MGHINLPVFIGAITVFLAVYLVIRLMVRSQEQYPGQSGIKTPWWLVAGIIVVLSLIVQAFWDGVFLAP